MLQQAGKASIGLRRERVNLKIKLKLNKNIDVSVFSKFHLWY